MLVTVAPEAIDVDPIVGAEYPDTVPHWTPVPVLCNTCPFVPTEAPAVRVPVKTAEDKVLFVSVCVAVSKARVSVRLPTFELSGKYNLVFCSFDWNSDRKSTRLNSSHRT